MPKDGTKTRERIVDRSARLFNKRGYWGTSLTDVLEATGLEKGGLYHHFGSKEALALEAFDHSVDLIRDRFGAALAGRRHAGGRLHALVDAWVGIVQHPPLPGGCPIQNTAVEATDTHPGLRSRARQAMTELLDGTVRRVIERGIERGEIRPDADAKAVATMFVAAGEGGIMLSRLYRDSAHMRRVGDQLHLLVDSLLTEPAP